MNQLSRRVITATMVAVLVQESPYKVTEPEDGDEPTDPLARTHPHSPVEKVVTDIESQKACDVRVAFDGVSDICPLILEDVADEA